VEEGEWLLGLSSAFALHSSLDLDIHSFTPHFPVRRRAVTPPSVCHRGHCLGFAIGAAIIVIPSRTGSKKEG